jgi:hypothetical protein
MLAPSIGRDREAKDVAFVFAAQNDFIFEKRRCEIISRQCDHPGPYGTSCQMVYRQN